MDATPIRVRDVTVMANVSTDPTTLIRRLGDGDARAADELIPLVYDALHDLAEQKLRREPSDFTLDSTALVHEVYLRLIDQSRVDWQGKTHFLAVGAIAMQRLILHHAERRRRQKRGGGWHRVTLSEAVAPGPEGLDIDVVALAELLERLAAVDQRQARIVQLRFLCNMTIDEVAEALGVSRRTVDGDWSMAKAWLRRELTRGETR
jgi:RNA polymerase sigma-70 factor (ECF subfamily)